MFLRKDSCKKLDRKLTSLSIPASASARMRLSRKLLTRIGVSGCSKVSSLASIMSSWYLLMARLRDGWYVAILASCSLVRVSPSSATQWSPLGEFLPWMNLIRGVAALGGLFLRPDDGGKWERGLWSEARPSRGATELESKGLNEQRACI